MRVRPMDTKLLGWMYQVTCRVFAARVKSCVSLPGTIHVYLVCWHVNCRNQFTLGWMGNWDTELTLSHFNFSVSPYVCELVSKIYHGCPLVFHLSTNNVARYLKRCSQINVCSLLLSDTNFYPCWPRASHVQVAFSM